MCINIFRNTAIITFHRLLDSYSETTLTVLLLAFRGTHCYFPNHAKMYHPSSKIRVSKIAIKHF